MMINHEYHKNKNITRNKNNTMEYIVLHDTAVIWDWNVNILAWNTNKKVSVHYLIRQDWIIYQFVDDDKIAWHCWISKREWKENMNNYCIWIELESDWVIFTTIQKEKLSNLVLYLMKTHDIPYQKIIRHKDIAPDRRSDPRDNLRCLEYDSFFEFKKNLWKFDKSLPRTLNFVLKYAIKLLWKFWNKSKSNYERNFIHEFTNEIRYFISKYK